MLVAVSLFGLELKADWIQSGGSGTDNTKVQTVRVGGTEIGGFRMAGTWVVSEEEVDGYGDTCSDWGRSGWYCGRKEWTVVVSQVEVSTTGTA